jgi:CheY-like chemotaxis protein
MQSTQGTQSTPAPDCRGTAAGTVQPARVLVVDENRLFRTAVAVMLEKQGYEVTVADDGAEALAALPAADVVLFDLDLTGFDGTRLLAALSREVREGQVRRRVVVALTEESDPTVHARLRALGVQQILLKPQADANAACRAVSAALPPGPGSQPVAA